MERVNLNSKEDCRNRQCYVAREETVLVRISGSCEVNVTALLPGMFVERVEDDKDGMLIIRVVDTDESESNIWRNTKWRCHNYDLIPVPTEAKQFFLAIQEYQDRIRLAKDIELCKKLQNIRINDTVWYYPYPYEHSEKLYPAIVKYIGPVPKLGKGHYFGLDLLEQSDLDIKMVNQLVERYISGTYSSEIFCAINKVRAFEAENVPSIGSTGKTENEVRNTMEHSGEKGKSILESSMVAVEKFGAFDDRKNNNREAASLSKDWYKSSKAAANSYMDNCVKSLESYPNVAAQSGNTSKRNDGKKCVHGDIPTNNLCVGSNVRVMVNSEYKSGVIRWIGTPTDIAPGKIMAGVELDDVHPLGTDGTYNNTRYFHCRPHRAIFTDIEQCSRYDSVPRSLIEEHATLIDVDNFGSRESSVIVGMVRPISVKGDLESICGKYRGIQGHHNSCYLDATLFSMFAFTSVFDNLLFRPPNEKDCPQYEEVQRVLREEIVNPLRQNIFVRADHVMKLRMLLEKLSSVSGLTSEEKDPEEFLTSLVAQILNAEPFLKLSSGQEAYHYQLFVEKDDHLNLPTVQQLLEQSFLTSNIRLKEVPSCLIIQMPRFGKSFKMYPKIQPTLLLDVTDIIEDSPRRCTVCGKLAKFECKECYGQCGVGLESIAFCLACLHTVHQHERRRTNHEPKKLSVPMEFAILQEHCPVPHLYMELSAVVCIETSHYVSFVKCGSGSEAPWCFFDSMADRKGEQNGYNIPEMVPCPDISYWLSEKGTIDLTDLTDDRQLPKHVKRLLCDAYMCMYQSPDVMMYK